MLQVRIGMDEYAEIHQASTIEGVSVSEYLRTAAADHAQRTFRVYDRLRQGDDQVEAS